MLVWVGLNQLAQDAKTNVYRIKKGLLDNYMREPIAPANYLNAPCVSPARNKQITL